MKTLKGVLWILLACCGPLTAQDFPHQLGTAKGTKALLSEGVVQAVNVETEEGFTLGAALVITDTEGKKLEFWLEEEGILESYFSNKEKAATTVGKKVSFAFTSDILKEVVEYRPVNTSTGLSKKGADPEKKITVFTIQGKQKNARPTTEGVEIELETPSGTIYRFIADASLFENNPPNQYNGQFIEISYLEIITYELLQFVIL